MEIRDLYDKNGNLTGETIFKGEVIPKDKYIAVVLVFIQNSDNKFLIQKRSKLKNGKYGSTSGHLSTGENSINGMVRELKEELGLSIIPSELQLLKSGKDDKRQYLYNIYYMKKDFDISNLKLQNDEVDFVEWDSIDEISKLIKDGKFTNSHSEIFLESENLLRNIS